VRELWVANRTPARAQALADVLGARAIGLDALDTALERADIVVVSTGATTPVLGRTDVERAMHRRRGRPLFVIDLGVPRDVEAAAGNVYNVFLYDLDDLGKVVADNRERRAHEADQAGAIVEEELARFARWFTSLDVVPTIKALRDHADAVRAEETQRALERLGHLDARDREIVTRYGEALMSKLLHAPMSELRRAASSEESSLLASAARTLFGLEPGAPDDEDEGEECGARESNPEPTG
jgi:glutamyl-tRNA reductase